MLYPLFSFIDYFFFRITVIQKGWSSSTCEMWKLLLWKHNWWADSSATMLQVRARKSGGYFLRIRQQKWFSIFRFCLPLACIACICRFYPYTQKRSDRQTWQPPAVWEVSLWPQMKGFPSLIAAWYSVSPWQCLRCFLVVRYWDAILDTVGKLPVLLSAWLQ